MKRGLVQVNMLDNVENERKEMTYTVSFVAVHPNAQPTRVLVLLDKKSKKWMLPGGKIDKPDISPAHTAFRETLEESGFQINLSNLRKIYNNKTACLYQTIYEFPEDRDTRMLVFQRRGQLNKGGSWVKETSDYGFAHLENNRFVIKSYSGLNKETQDLRGGTDEMLRAALHS